ncbi:hypothetical protein ACFQMM_03280 [Saliphagus sp. GCM10025308]
MSGLLADETVIVTGGTRGIGRAIVDRFAAEERTWSSLRGAKTT